MVISSFRQTISLVRELGLGTSILYLLSRLLQRISSNGCLYYYLFVAQPLTEKPRLPVTRGKAFVFRLMLGSDLVLESLDRPPKVIRERIQRGAKCLAAFKNEALVGWIWFIHECYLEDEVRVKYVLPRDGGCVWDFDVFVSESERLGFLFAKQWDAFDSMLKPQGVHHTLSRINAFNQRSIASHRSLGAKVCGRALFVRIGPLQWMLASRRPFISFGGIPTLRLSPKADSWL